MIDRCSHGGLATLLALGLENQTDSPYIEIPLPPEAGGGRVRPAAPPVFSATPRPLARRRAVCPFTFTAVLEAVVLVLLALFIALAFCWPQVIDAVRRRSLLPPAGDYHQQPERERATDGPPQAGAVDARKHQHAGGPASPGADGRPNGTADHYPHPTTRGERSESFSPVKPPALF